MPLFGFALSLILLVQSGWTISPGPPREVKRLYWELLETTEVWVRLTPGDPSGNRPLVNLVFQAFFPGRAQRDPFSGVPQWPRGTPTRLVVRAEPSLLTVIRNLSLRFVLDSYTFDLTSPGSRYTLLPCGIGSDDCAPNGVEAELHPTLLRALLVARIVGGEALGFPIQLAAADQAALANFAERIGVSANRTDKR